MATNDLSIVRKEEPAYFGTSESSGLHQAPTNGAQVRRRWKYYDLFDKAPGTSPMHKLRVVLMMKCILL